MIPRISDAVVELGRGECLARVLRAVRGGSAGCSRPVRRPGRGCRSRRSAPTSGSPCSGRSTGCSRSSASRRVPAAACGPSLQFGSVPSKNRATTLLSVFGIVMRFLSDCGWTGPTKPGRFAGSGFISAKNAANSQNCSRVYGANGWSWHWAHSSFTPRNSRLTADPMFSGRGLVRLIEADEREAVRVARVRPARTGTAGSATFTVNGTVSKRRTTSSAGVLSRYLMRSQFSNWIPAWRTGRWSAFAAATRPA